MYSPSIRFVISRKILVVCHIPLPTQLETKNQSGWIVVVDGVPLSIHRAVPDPHLQIPLASPAGRPLPPLPRHGNLQITNMSHSAAHNKTGNKNQTDRMDLGCVYLFRSRCAGTDQRLQISPSSPTLNPLPPNSGHRLHLISPLPPRPRPKSKSHAHPARGP
jgi:hypothetical protein